MNIISIRLKLSEILIATLINMNTAEPIVYLFDAKEKPSRELIKAPIVKATSENVEEFGYLVNDPKDCDIEIVQWPAQGWRGVDPGTGDEAGSVEGVFSAQWCGDVLMGTNEAVNGEYVLGWSTDPQQADNQKATVTRDQILLWNFNYHPDGGQMFFPLDNQPFVIPVAPAGDDLSPDQVVALWLDGSQGLYIHPNVWHVGIIPVFDQQRFLDRQGRVHARVSADFGEEFGVYVSIPLMV